MVDKPGTEPPCVPEKLKHGKVLHYAVLDDTSELTGKTKRMIDGKPLLKPAGLAVVHYELSQGGVFLF